MTLLEALVAIFVMGIGLLALLTLFPLGALRMAKAIQDDACSQLGANARSIAVFKAVPWDVGVAGSYSSPGNGLALPAHPNYPSYPVFVDPIGFRASNLLPGQGNLCGGSFVARTSVSFVNTTQDALQWFTRQDDIIFENALPTQTPLVQLVPPNPGQPQVLAGAGFGRDTRYSYALQFQQARAGDAMVVDVAVVVYAKRPVTPTPGGIALPEYFYNTTIFDTSRNAIIIDYSAGNVPPPPVNIGDWVMDNTYVPIPNGNNPPTNAFAHGGWYRITGVNDLGNSQVELEVEMPIRGFPLSNANPPVAGNPSTWLGQAIILDGVAEVYTVGTIRLP